MNCEEIWHQCLNLLKDNITEVGFNTWFTPIVPIKHENNTLHLRVPSQFFYEYLEENYSHLLKKVIDKEYGSKTNVVYNVVVDKDNTYQSSINIPAHEIVETKNKPNSFVTQYEKISNPFIVPGLADNNIDPNLNSKYTFSQFVEGDCNRLGKAAGASISDFPGTTAFNPLFVYGESGVGKTHLSQAIAHEILKKFPEKIVLYVSSHTFTTQYTDAIVRQSINNFIHFYQKIDVLILDDVHHLAGKFKTQETLFNILNHLHQLKKQIILTADKAPVDLEGLSERLISRFKWGLSAEIKKPDFEARVKIIKHKAFQDGIVFKEDIVEYIAQNLDVNVREIEGFLISLMAHSVLAKKEIDVDLIKNLMSKFVKVSDKKVTIDKIQSIVAKFYNIPIDDINSKTRKREVVQARQIAMHFAKSLTNHSLSEIGMKIGKRDHATVLHSCKIVKDLCDTDKDFKADLDAIAKKINVL